MLLVHGLDFRGLGGQVNRFKIRVATPCFLYQGWIHTIQNLCRASAGTFPAGLLHRRWCAAKGRV